MLVGFGYDSHKLVEGRKLIIGGVEIPSKKGSKAHSDGDVLVHALIDALLGATGKGDIGLLFPDTDPKYKDISSLILLKRVMKNFKAKIINIDSTVVLDKPKLNSYIDKMKLNLSKILKTNRINIKSKTSENINPDRIEAYAVVLVEEK